MSTVVTVILAIVGILGVLVSIGWLGLRTPPKGFPPHPHKTRDLGTVELPPSLPKAVYRHFAATLGSQVPKIESAVVWGRARFRLPSTRFGLWMPVRFKAYYIPGQDFYRHMEITWFRLPILRGYDSYLKGEGALKLEGVLNVSETGEKTNQSQNLALWAEAVLMPSVLVTDSRIRWEEVDDVTSRLVVPFGEQEESLLVRFDPQTGLMTQMSAQRYRDQEEEKTPWRIECLDWETFHLLKIPRLAVTWEDESGPWSFWTVDGVEYNVDVSEKIPGATLPSR